MPFHPGPGLGGHCIPLDPFYLTWKAAEHGVWAHFIELAGDINTSIPRYAVLILGLSCKANIDDDRESPSFEIMAMLRDRGAEVAYCDPYVPVTRKTPRHDLCPASVPTPRLG